MKLEKFAIENPGIIVLGASFLILALVARFIGAIRRYHEKLRDKQFIPKRDALFQFGMKVMSGLKVGYVVSANKYGTHLDVSCTGTRDDIDHARGVLLFRLSELTPPATATVWDIADPEFKSQPCFNNHIFMHRIVTNQKQSNESVRQADEKR